MSWLALRVLLAALAVGLGALLSWLAVRLGSSTWVADLVGASVAVLGVLMLDAVRGQRLLQWLRGDLLGTAPRDTGLWGELAYRVERALRQRERELAQERTLRAEFLSAVEASPNGVLLLDAQDHIQWCNRVAATHFSLDPRRDLRQRITNLVRYPAFVAYLQTGVFDEPLLLAHVRGGATLSVLVRGYGEGMRLVLSQDVTERERNDAMRRDFVANVSHEIRTPLTVVSGFLETLASLPLSSDERARVLQLMTQQTDRMQTLVGDLLTLAQLEGSPRPASDSWVSLDGLLGRAASDAQALSAGRHQIQVAGDTGVELAGQETELLSAVGNLLSNAVRYTPAGGQIQLAWTLQPDGSGELVVSDTGPGIAREHLPRLTERFYRVDGSRSRETGGTGLGLSIVKHVVQRHGGELQVHSELGKGSSFRISLPAVRVRSANGESEIGMEAALPASR